MMSMSILIYLVRLLLPSSSSGSSPSTNTGISKSWHISGRSLTASQLALVECSPKGPNPVTTRVISQRKMLPQTLQSVKSLQPTASEKDCNDILVPGEYFSFRVISGAPCRVLAPPHRLQVAGSGSCGDLSRALTSCK